MDDLAIQTVARNFATKLVLALLGWGGGALVSHGWATDNDVQQAVPAVAQIIVGVLVSGGAGVLAYIRAKNKRAKEIGINNAPAGSVPVK